MDLWWTSLPIPSHTGIIISSKVIQELGIEKSKKLLLWIDIEKGFERLTSGTKIKLVEEIGQETIWIVRWYRGTEEFIALISGSEF